MGLLTRKKHTSTPPPAVSAPLPASSAAAAQQGLAGHSDKYKSAVAGTSGIQGYSSNLPSPPRSPVDAVNKSYSHKDKTYHRYQGSADSRPHTGGSRYEDARQNPASFSSGHSAAGSNVLHNELGTERSSATTTISDREMEGKMLGLELRGGGSGGQQHQRAGRDSVDSIQMNDGTQDQQGHHQQQSVPAAVPRNAPQQQQQQQHAYNSNNGNNLRPISTATSVLSPTPSQTSSFARKTSSRYTLSDFTFIRTLGTGSFGRVHLVRSRHNQRSYAIKVLLKERVVKMKQVEHTNSEREMLERVRHPFLVNLWGTFKDSRNLYMVMDFVAGGELFSLLRKSQRFPDPVAKFFAAEVALALDYLHSLDIIYRDLKPENILLGADGHVKITDFGFAKYVPDITWTLCGTPDYLAPEIVQSRGYNKSVDWYALGVLIFEMLAGYPPFFTEDSNPMRLYEKIIAGKVRYPSYFTPEAKDLLKSLLTTDITKRFGNLANGSRDIFGHVWFQEVDWERLYRKEIPAPYVPKVEGDWDASNFDVYPEIDLSEYGLVGPDPHGHLFPSF